MTPGQHSETAAAHSVNRQMLSYLRGRWGADQPLVADLARQAEEHTAIFELFGRYPHRNQILGRPSTAAEEEWLSGRSRPGWADTQARTCLPAGISHHFPSR
jgi:uncharacterized protein (DUF924 family)